MKSSCLKYKQHTENINPRVSNTKNPKKLFLWQCSEFGSKKLRFIKNQEAKRLLNDLSIRIPLNKVPILGDILF